MKKILFLLAAVTFIMLAACTKEVITPNVNDTEVSDGNTDKSTTTGSEPGNTGTGTSNGEGDIVDPNDPYTRKPKKN